MAVLHNLWLHFILRSRQKNQKLRITYVIRNFCLICDYPQVLLSALPHAAREGMCARENFVAFSLYV